MAKKSKPEFEPLDPRAELVRDELVNIIADAYERFEGPLSDLEQAVGILILGRFVGYQAVRLSHTPRYLKRMERILGVKFKEVLPARTADSRCVGGVRMADAIGKFWQVIASSAVKPSEAEVFDRNLQLT